MFPGKIDFQDQRLHDVPLKVSSAILDEEAVLQIRCHNVSYQIRLQGDGEVPEQPVALHSQMAVPQQVVIVLNSDPQGIWKRGNLRENIRPARLEFVQA